MNKEKLEDLKRHAKLSWSRNPITGDMDWVVSLPLRFFIEVESEAIVQGNFPLRGDPNYFNKILLAKILEAIVEVLVVQRGELN